MSGHKLRILSSENDASVKVQQDQNTNITLKLEHTPSQADLKESVPQINASPPYAPPGFTPGTPLPIPLPQEASGMVGYPYPSVVPTVNPIQERSIDLTEDLADKDAQIEVLEALQIEVLEALLSCYENNPLIINKFVVCQYNTLMNIIKVLTSAEKVEFSLDEDRSCTCCNSKYIYISKIFVTKDGKTQEFKHAYNEKYSLLTKHGVSLKICTR